MTRSLSFLWALGLSISSTLYATQYSITALNVLPGGIDSFAFGLNDIRQVSGDSRLDRSTNIGQSRPVIWNYSGVPTELWSDPVVGGSAADINNNSVAVGRYGSGSGIPTPGPGVPPGRGFVWDSVNGRRDLGLTPFGNSIAAAINDSRQVVGTSEILETVIINGMPETSFVPHPFIWDETNGIRDLGNLGGIGGFANAINAQGQAVGWSTIADGSQRAFIWTEAGDIQAIPTISGGQSRAFAINDLGQVLGSEDGVGAFIWDQQNGAQVIPVGGYAFNNLAQVVGGPIGDLLLWDQADGVRHINDLLPPDNGWQLEVAFAMNDAGAIVGYGTFNGQIRGFLLTPVPEPATAALIIGVVVGIAFSARSVHQIRGTSFPHTN
jgi:probable HAF family extracellular repeat protein